MNEGFGRKKEKLCEREDGRDNFFFQTLIFNYEIVAIEISFAMCHTFI